MADELNLETLALTGGRRRKRRSELIATSAPGAIQGAGIFAPLVGLVAGFALKKAQALEVQQQQQFLFKLQEVLSDPRTAQDSQALFADVVGIGQEYGMEVDEVISLAKGVKTLLDKDQTAASRTITAGEGEGVEGGPVTQFSEVEGLVNQFPGAKFNITAQGPSGEFKYSGNLDQDDLKSLAARFTSQTPPPTTGEGASGGRSPGVTQPGATGIRPLPTAPQTPNQPKIIRTPKGREVRVLR